MIMYYPAWIVLSLTILQLLCGAITMVNIDPSSKEVSNKPIISGKDHELETEKIRIFNRRRIYEPFHSKISGSKTSRIYQESIPYNNRRRIWRPPKNVHYMQGPKPPNYSQELKEAVAKLNPDNWNYEHPGQPKPIRKNPPTLMAEYFGTWKWG
ncbi:uncharacterized protein LOC123296708 [Chrysoperla carnea]|uniref:uncharacterized protein LOC123296708 n=1 Tax=Chrysoperla carnea TaxID=189513 RepID=UPI001D080F3C|nr:uncharacterized protein LOC123296708 [Chrysoperla carnea]